MPAEAPVTSAVFAFDIMGLRELGIAVLMTIVMIDGQQAACPEDSLREGSSPKAETRFGARGGRRYGGRVDPAPHGGDAPKLLT